MRRKDVSLICHVNYNTREIFKSYKSSNDYNGESLSLFNKICYLFNKKFMNSLIHQSNELRFPCGLGMIRIRKKNTFTKPNNLKGDAYNSSYIPTNWLASRKEGKRILEFNDHRGGYKYEFFWTKNANLSNGKKYRFVPSRTNKRELAKILKTRPEIDYFE